jgi:hypothetical protein
VGIFTEEQEEEFPAEVHCMFNVEGTDGERFDLGFVQFYEHVYDNDPAGKRKVHPYIPNSKSYYLGDVFGLYTPDLFVHPWRMIPNLAPNSAREPVGSARHSTGQTGALSRPRFFGVRNIL